MRRQARKPITALPLAKSGNAAGSGTAGGLMRLAQFSVQAILYERRLLRPDPVQLLNDKATAELKRKTSSPFPIWTAKTFAAVVAVKPVVEGNVFTCYTTSVSVTPSHD